MNHLSPLINPVYLQFLTSRKKRPQMEMCVCRHFLKNRKMAFFLQFNDVFIKMQCSYYVQTNRCEYIHFSFDLKLRFAV